ncbi:centrosomin isoform X2 [Neocloeon triangulifer]|uniref:centrosomin isoform X2 n=1 Tax=Neocloeon triangulifer TaxID=2078957 RepID=UPI00286F674A|nr:centrosomin isoform X2 [Neocloeon triangulifer]
MEVIPEEGDINSFLFGDNTSPSQLESIIFDAEETSDSPFSELLQNQPAAATSMSGRTVKQYEEELRILKKENFNLKLRIYFLEERMQKLGKPLSDGDGAEKKLIELKVQMETLRREMQSKQVLLAQAGKAIEMMEEQHNSEMEKLRKELESRPVSNGHPKPMENSMALYADAFDLPSSFLMPPPPPPGRGSKVEKQDPEVVESLQLQINDLEQKLQNVSEELVSSQERERRLNEALESKAPEIQIKVQELCFKDKLLEDQRRIIVEIQIRLDEKLKELESLRQSLDSQQTVISQMEADHQMLSKKLVESEEKQKKSMKVVQTLVTKNKELHNQITTIQEKYKNLSPDQIGQMHQEENEHLWTELECQRKQVEKLTKENSELLREKAATEAELHAEISDLQLQLERAQRKTSVIPSEVGGTAIMMMSRLDELAAFLATLLRRPHLLSAFSAANRASLLQLVENSLGNARQKCTTLSMSWMTEHTLDHDMTNLSSAGHEESLINQIQAFLKGPEQQEFLQEVEARKDRTADLWPVSISSDLDSGKEIELARWSLEKSKVQPPPRPPRKHEIEEQDEEDEEIGSGATAVERKARGNHSESEAWSEPDRTVSLARIGLPENKTPVNQGVSSPASSEQDHSPKTPGKKASYKKLVHRLHATEQINEALLAEVSGYKTLLKTHNSDVIACSPSYPLQQSMGLSVTTEMIQELEFQRSRLEKMLHQNEAMRQQLEVTACVAKAKEGISVYIRRLTEAQEKLEKANIKISELENLLGDATTRIRHLESQLSERDQLHSQLQKVQHETQEALASMEKAKATMQEEILQTRKMCQQLETKALEATSKCQHMEEASKKDIERCEILAHQVEEAQQHCQLLTHQIHQLEASKSTANHSTAPSSLVHLSDSDEIFNGTGSVPSSTEATQRHTLSSPDLGIDSDTGRCINEIKEDEKSRLNHENRHLKQRLALSQRIIENCLETLNKKNRDRLKVQASMEEQLLRTEEVLQKASHNLKMLPSVPKTP